MVVPSVIITESIGLTNFHVLDSTTNTAGFRHSGGGTPSPQNETDIFVEGTQAVSIKASGSTRDEGVWAFDFGTVDLSTNANKHVFLWAAITTVSQHDTIENGGIYVIVASSSGTNWNKYFVGGSDVSDSAFKRYVIDVTKKPSETSGTPADLSAITHIGIGVKGTITAKSENVILDRVDFGTGLAIEGGQASQRANWEQLFLGDDANKYGIIEKRGGIYFLKGGIRIGDASGAVTTSWIDGTNSVVEFDDPTYHNGDAIVSAITAEDLYRIEVVGNATGTTNVSWGVVIGSGDDRQGVLGGVIRSDGPKWDFDLDGDLADIDTVNLYGMQIQGAGSVTLDGASKEKVIGVDFVNCDEVAPNECEWLNNTIVSPIPDRGMEFDALLPTTAKQTKFVFPGSSARPTAHFVWQVTVAPTPDTFVDQTSNFNGSGASATIFFPASEAVGDYCAFGSIQKFGRLRVNVGTAGVGGTVTWEYWDGSSWTALESLIDGTSNLTSTGNGNVDYKTPTDWAAVSLNGESPLFYVRAVVATTYSTNPLGSGGSFRNLVNHMVNHPQGATVSYDAMEFFGISGRFFDVENSVFATAIVPSNLSDDDTDQIVGDGTTDGIAQSFAGVNGTWSSVLVKLSKLGAPTGNITCFLYAHSGTFGSSSIPTGAPLATSEPVDIASIVAGSDFVYKFRFLDEFLLVGGTEYVFSIEYTGGDGANHLIVRYDTTVNTPTGNKSTLAAAVWSAQAGDDMVFFIATGGIVTINASNGSNPVESDNTGDPPGVVIINNAVNLTVNVEDVDGNALSDVRAAIFTDDLALTELLNEDTVAGVASASFNFTSDQDVTIRVRESPNTADPRFIPFFTRGTITVDGFSLDVILQDDPIASVTT